MKSCRGCRYLVHAVVDVCRLRDPGWERVANPYTERHEWRTAGGRSAWRPEVSVMRAPDGECGPAAKYRSPNLWRRLWRYFLGGEA